MIAEIRAAITTWLQSQTASSANIGTVYSVPPRITPTGAFVPPGAATSGSGAIVFLYIETVDQKLISMGGPESGVYSGVYAVNLVVVSQNVAGDVVKAQTTMDNAMGELTRAIMANRTANTINGTVFVWGLGGRSGDEPDIKGNMELPLTVGQKAVYIWGSINVMVQELTQQGATI
jgi:hypothetical protein